MTRPNFAYILVFLAMIGAGAGQFARCNCLMKHMTGAPLILFTVAFMSILGSGLLDQYWIY